jgi:putative colanic acid biosynthesis acetyltransferase WcaF
MEQPDQRRDEIPVIPLRQAPGERSAWGRSAFTVYLWGLCEWLFVTNALQVSSRVRVWMLRRFGATIGTDVVFRPRTRVKFPWKLTIGDDCWIGEGVWIHNQDEVTIGADVVISQESMLTTGSHAHRSDMALVTAPIFVEDGVWITSRCLILGGATIGRSALVAPMSVVSGHVAAGRIVRGNPAADVGARFRERP